MKNLTGMIFVAYICRNKNKTKVKNKQFTYEPKHAQIDLR